jgi:hypothetical protein|tara:strand:- start:613 stop:759 length:147 start_codon:yes stop_codon:yes gene_type:complete
MKLFSPDGKISIDVHPSKVESLLNKGWKEEATKSKSSSKKEVKENGST